MREISLHIMDVVENGITAGSDLIQILIDEERVENRLNVVIKDNGKGMSPEMVSRVTDPFVTTRTTRRVGLGLSLLKEAAKRCAGDFSVESEPGRGTCVTATFRYDHIDLAPIGDIAGTITMLIAGNPDIDFVYDHVIDGKRFTIDTRELREELGESLTDPALLFHLKKQIEDELKKLAGN
ncbi:MAG: ATP-binding protein [Desulfobacteraceae bacterium]|nr:MAG: ATP-binding protein [Desulfobacteraceae bacterium]